MATLVFTAIGTLLGGPLGGAIGALAGRQVDSLILGGRGGREGPRLNELSVTTSSYGMPIPRHFGRMRVAGQIIWATDLVEHRESSGGGKGRPSTTEYSYTASFAVALASRPILGVRRIWADGKLLRGAAGDLKVGGTFRLHPGFPDQAADSLLLAAEAQGRCPAYTGLAYAVFEDLQLSDFGNRLPALTFEVIADEGPLTLADLCQDVLDDVDASVPLPGVVGLSMEGSLDQTLDALDPLFPADCDACDSRLTLRPDRNQGVPILLSDPATSTERDDFGGNTGYARKRVPNAEQPVAVLRYYDVDRDFQPGAQRANGRPAPGQLRTIELPAALAAPDARRLIDQAAKRTQWARQTVSWRVTQLDPAVRPGTTVRLPGHAGLWRVRDWEWRSHGIDLALVRLSPTVEGTANADPGRPLPAADRPPAPTVLAACEVPWDGNPGTAVPLILAAASSPSAEWSGAILFADHGDGALLPLGQSGRVRSTIGTANTVLSAASPMFFDRTSSVTITLCSDDLSLGSATVRQLAMGANRAVLGEELIQFATAEAVGAGIWRLSGLLRGRGGTEDAVTSHSAGESFILLDGAATAVDPQGLGTAAQSTLAAVALGDAQPARCVIQLQGIGPRPLAPVHGRRKPVPGGGLVISWVRRARGAWQWNDGVDVPIGEQSEAYDVTFGIATATVARWETYAPSLVLDPAEVAALLAQAPSGQFEVRQRGDRAVSLPLSIPLT